MAPTAAIAPKGRAGGRPPARYCGARTRRGTTCKRGAGWGTDHPGVGSCKNHGGRTRSGRIAAYRQEAQEELALTSSLVVEPQDALLECVRRTAGLAAYCRARQAEAAREGADELEADGRLAPWARVEAEQTERLARFSKMALDAGVAERRVRLAERAGDQIAAAVDAALAELDLSPRKRQAFVRRFGAELAAIEASDVLEGTGA